MSIISVPPAEGIKTSGEHTFGTATSGTGVFSDYLTSSGTFSNSLSSRRGLWGKFTCAATTNSIAGFRTSGRLTERNRDFTFRCDFQLDSATNVNLFVGFCNKIDDFESGADPLNSDSGIAITSHSDGLLKIAHHDDLNTDSLETVFEDFTDPIPFDTGSYNLSIQSTNSLDGNVFVYCIGESATGSAIISADLPSLTRDLGIQVYVQTTADEAKMLSVYDCYGEF